MPIRQTLGEFKEDIRRAKEKLDTDFRTALSALIYELVKITAESTPIDTGRASASWFVTTGAGSQVMPEGSYPDGPRLSTDRAGDLKFSNTYAIWMIYNLLPYIEVLEYGLYPGDGPKTVGGYSTQAPLGMLRLALAEVHIRADEIIANAIRQ
jgi:hypothetical protein